MYNATNQFKNCMKAPLRNRAHIQVSIGIINSLAQSNGEIISALEPWSNERSIWKANTVGTQYATFEDDFFKADGSQYLLPEPDVDLATYNTDTGVVSEDILGAITITFNQEYDLKGLTVRFGEFYPTEFTVTVDGGTFTYTNDSSEFDTSDTYGVTSSMTITPISMVGGQQRLRIEEITMGIGFSFTDEVIKNVTTREDISFISNKISGNTFELTATDLGNNFNVDDSNSYINYLETEQRINVIVGLDLDDGTVEWIQQGVYYLTKWSKEGINVKLSADNRLAFLTDTYNSGNYIHERTLYDDFIDLMQFANIEIDEYNVDDTLKSITVINPLPSVPVNQALQLIANAGRCVCYQDRNGVIQMMANFSLVVDPDDMQVTTSSATDYSHPQNILVGTTEVYADFTDNFFSADGSMFILPESGNDYSHDTGFVSSEIADENGEFSTVPSITVLLPASFIYYGFNINFDGNPPREMLLQVYNDNVLVAEETIRDLENENYIPYSFRKFDKLILSFPKATPYNRVLVNKFSFSDLTDYKLTFNDIIGNMKGDRGKNVKTVKVRQYTFLPPTTEGEYPQQKNDGVFYSVDVMTTGDEVKVNNPLVSNSEHARLIAEWVKNYYTDNVSYSCTFRGDPTLNATDIIHLDSDILNNLQVEIEKHTFTYNGAFGGTLEMRRAVRTE